MSYIEKAKASQEILVRVSFNCTNCCVKLQLSSQAWYNYLLVFFPNLLLPKGLTTVPIRHVPYGTLSETVGTIIQNIWRNRPNGCWHTVSRIRKCHTAQGLMLICLHANFLGELISDGHQNKSWREVCMDAPIQK